MSKEATTTNIYQLDGRVPLAKAVPFGLQHIMAMFVSNIAPILIVAEACGLSEADTAKLIQTAMIVAGIGSLIQIYPLRRIGSRCFPVFCSRYLQNHTGNSFPYCSVW